MINGEQYLEFEDWQTLGRFYGATVGVEWTKPLREEIDEKGNTKLIGYEAKAIVYIKGEIVSSAEAMCLFTERNWKGKDEFTLRSMAQTRASAKALRNVLAWVAVLGGFKPTPLEEMPSDMPRTVVSNTEKIPTAVNKVVDNVVDNEVPPDQYTDQPWNRPRVAKQGECSIEGCAEKITDKVKDYSLNKFGAVYCYNHQKEQQ